MSAVCTVCGKVWGGPTLGKMFHCKPLKPVRIKQKKSDLPAVINDQKMCECGSVATTTSAVSSRPDPVCQRCHDCELGGYTINHPKPTTDHTYAVRLPRKNL